jgi:hypothetical protein
VHLVGFIFKTTDEISFDFLKGQDIFLFYETLRSPRGVHPAPFSLGALDAFAAVKLAGV